MSATTEPLSRVGAWEPDIPRERRRIRGLSMPVLPSWPLLAQVGGALAALTGVYQEWGGPVAMMVGGVAAVVVGALRESGRI